MAAAMLVYHVVCSCEALDPPEHLDRPRGDTPVVPIPHSTGPGTESGRDSPAVTRAGRPHGQSLSSALPGSRAQTPSWGAGSQERGSVPAPQRRPVAEASGRHASSIPSHCPTGPRGVRPGPPPPHVPRRQGGRALALAGNAAPGPDSPRRDGLTHWR